jgi:uncharacterized protein YciI
MRSTLTVVTVLVALGSSASPAVAQEMLPPPQAWDTSYVVLLEVNPAYRPSAAEDPQATVQSHFQYQLRLIADGRTIMGGPLVAEADAPLVGITVVRAASLDEAKAIAAADPAVRAGLFTTTVRTWTTAAAARPGASPAHDPAPHPAPEEPALR